MGFYSPATIVEDARRHGVRILPVDELRSQRDCTIESDPESSGGFALRIGLRYVKGISNKDLAALASVPENLHSIEELVHRTGISKVAVQKLAEAGAFRDLSLNRRTALWAALGIRPRKDLIPATGSTLKFAPLSAHESTTWDYQSTGVSSSGHMLRH